MPNTRGHNSSTLKLEEQLGSKKLSSSNYGVLKFRLFKRNEEPMLPSLTGSASAPWSSHLRWGRSLLCWNWSRRTGAALESFVHWPQREMWELSADQLPTSPTPVSGPGSQRVKTLRGAPRGDNVFDTHPGTGRASEGVWCPTVFLSVLVFSAWSWPEMIASCNCLMAVKSAFDETRGLRSDSSPFVLGCLCFPLLFCSLSYLGIL